MTDTAVPTSPPAASVSAIEREVRRHRIMERVLGGWSYELIASTENLTPRRIRQIVKQSLKRSPADRAAEHIRLQTARLGAPLRLAAQKIDDGDLGAIDRLLRVLDRLDRYQTRAAAPPPFDEAAEGAARFDAKLDDLVATAAEDKARAAAARGGPTAARRRARRRRDSRCAPPIAVERSPQAAIPAIARSGASAMRFAIVPSPAPRWRTMRPPARKPLQSRETPQTWKRRISKDFKRISKDFKRLQKDFKGFQRISKDFKIFPKISAAVRTRATRPAPGSRPGGPFPAGCPRRWIRLASLSSGGTDERRRRRNPQTVLSQALAHGAERASSSMAMASGNTDARRPIDRPASAVGRGRDRGRQVGDERG